MGPRGEASPYKTLLGTPSGSSGFRSKFSLAFAREQKILKALLLTCRRYLQRGHCQAHKYSVNTPISNIS